MHARPIILLPLVCLFWLLGLPAAAQDRARTGWHGETMPAGLSKGAKEGEYIWKKDGSVMVYVPAGPFPMGSELESDEQPIHEVYLDAFYIDKYEVSWKQWKMSGLPYSDSPNSRLLQVRPPDWGIVDNQPVLNVSWEEAKKYTAWVGKRLPTEAEWEKAARGTDGRKYPWGNEEPNFQLAIWTEHPTAQVSTGDVDCCEAGASPYGVHNMAGNIYEWCEDVYSADFYMNSPKKNPVYQGPGRFRVLRGGAFPLEISDLRSAYRYRSLPYDRAPYLGFRTVLSNAKLEVRTE